MQKFTAEIKRWNDKANKFVTQKIDTKDGFGICTRIDHQFCTHTNGEMVLRGAEVTHIAYYPSQNKVVIHARKEIK
jgi:hypothetical protein